MLNCLFAIFRKDMRIAFAHGAGIVQALLLGLLLIFLFSLSMNTGERLTPQASAAVFWLASAFCQVLIFNMLYAAEEEEKAGTGLLLIPAPVQVIWLGKALAGMLVLLAAQCILIPAVFVFLGQDPGPSWPCALAGIILCDLGMAASGSLLGALAAGHSGRESLLSIVLFPLLVPLLLAGVRLVCQGMDPDPAPGIARWLGIAVAFDCMFLASGLLLFPFVCNGED